MWQWLSYFINLLQWIIFCNTFYTHPHSVSGFMPQFVTKSAYCTGFPCGANTTSVCIIYCVKFTYTILLYLSNLKYKQYTLLVDVRNWLSSAIFWPYSLIYCRDILYFWWILWLWLIYIYLSRFRVSWLWPYRLTALKQLLLHKLQLLFTITNLE
jgi:hypothetical protein